VSPAEETLALLSQLELRIVQRISESYKPIWEEVLKRGNETKEFEKKVELSLQRVEASQSLQGDQLGHQSDQLQQHMQSDEDNFSAMRSLLDGVKSAVTQLQVAREVARQVAEQVAHTEGSKAAKEHSSRSTKIVSSVLVMTMGAVEALDQSGFFDWISVLLKSSGN